MPLPLPNPGESLAAFLERFGSSRDIRRRHPLLSDRLCLAHGLYRLGRMRYAQEGGPCKSGQTAAQTGCTPKEDNESGDTNTPAENRQLISADQISRRIEEVGPSQLREVNTVGHHSGSRKLINEIAESMRENGWQGLPILAFKREDTWQALTGSHRLMAARRADLDSVPVVFLDHDDMLAWAQKAGMEVEPDEEFAGNMTDEKRLRVLKAGDDPVAQYIMEEEVKKED